MTANFLFSRLIWLLIDSKFSVFIVSDHLGWLQKLQFYSHINITIYELSMYFLFIYLFNDKAFDTLYFFFLLKSPFMSGSLTIQAANPRQTLSFPYSHGIKVLMQSFGARYSSNKLFWNMSLRWFCLQLSMMQLIEEIVLKWSFAFSKEGAWKEHILLFGAQDFTAIQKGRHLKSSLLLFRLALAKKPQNFYEQ